MTDFPAITASLGTAPLRLHSVRSPFERIRAALDAARARHEAQRGYHYLLDHADPLRDVGASASNVRRSLRELR